MLNNSCTKLHRQKGLNLILFSNDKCARNTGGVLLNFDGRRPPPGDRVGLVLSAGRADKISRGGHTVVWLISQKVQDGIP